MVTLRALRVLPVAKPSAAAVVAGVTGAAQPLVLIGDGNSLLAVQCQTGAVFARWTLPGVVERICVCDQRDYVFVFCGGGGGGGGGAAGSVVVQVDTVRLRVMRQFHAQRKEDAGQCVAAAFIRTPPCVVWGRTGKPGLMGMTVAEVDAEPTYLKLDDARRPVTCLCTHHGRGAVFSGHNEGTVRYHDVSAATGAVVATFVASLEYPNNGNVTGLAMHPTREMLLAAYQSGTIVSWTVTTDGGQPGPNRKLSPSAFAVAMSFATSGGLLYTLSNGSAVYTAVDMTGLPTSDQSVPVPTSSGGVTGTFSFSSSTGVLAQCHERAVSVVSVSQHGPTTLPAIATTMPIPQTDPPRLVFANMDGVCSSRDGKTDLVCRLPSGSGVPTVLRAASAEMKAFLVVFGDQKACRCVGDSAGPLNSATDACFLGTSDDGAEYCFLDPAGSKLSATTKDSTAKEITLPFAVERLWRAPSVDGAAQVLVFSSADLSLSLVGLDGAVKCAYRLIEGELVWDAEWSADGTRVAFVTNRRVALVTSKLIGVVDHRLPGSSAPCAVVWMKDTPLYTCGGGLYALWPKPRAHDQAQATRLCSVAQTVCGVVAVSNTGVVLASGQGDNLRFFSRSVGWLQALWPTYASADTFDRAAVETLLKRWDSRRVDTSFIKSLAENLSGAALSILLHTPLMRFSLATRAFVAIKSGRLSDAAGFVQARAAVQPLWEREDVAVARHVAAQCARANAWEQAASLYRACGDNAQADLCAEKQLSSGAGQAQLDAGEHQKFELAATPLPTELEPWLGSVLRVPAPKRAGKGGAAAGAAGGSGAAELDDDDAQMSAVKQDNRQEDDEGFMEQPDLAAEYRGGLGGDNADGDKGDKGDKAEASGGAGGGDEAQRNSDDEAEDAMRAKMRKLRFTIKERPAGRTRAKPVAAFSLGDLGTPGSAPASTTTQKPTPKPFNLSLGSPDAPPAASVASTSSQPASGAAASASASTAAPAPGAQVTPAQAIEALQTAVVHLESGQFMEGIKEAQRALGIIKQTLGRERPPLVRAAAAYLVCMRILAVVRGQDTSMRKSKAEAALCAHVMTTLRIKPQHRATCLGIAARMNAEVGNFHTATMLIKEQAELVDEDRRPDLLARAAAMEERGPDQGPPHLLGATGLNAFCHDTLAVVLNRQCEECDVCGLRCSAGGNGAPCGICAIGTLETPKPRSQDADAPVA